MLCINKRLYLAHRDHRGNLAHKGYKVNLVHRGHKANLVQRVPKEKQAHRDRRANRQKIYLLLFSFLKYLFKMVNRFRL